MDPYAYDNDKPGCLKSTGFNTLRLTPFILLIILYFALVTDDTSVVISSILKCAPIIALAAFVFLKGFRFTTQYRYSQMILLGLVFSCFGDLFLNIDLFPVGMGAFAIAQIFYIIAFELKPWNFIIGVPVYCGGVGLLITAYICGTMETAIQIGLPIYAFLLTTMCWRALVRAYVRRGFLATLCAIGSLLFVASDAMICVSMFISSFEHERVLIMSTYYAAQFLIALSTLRDVM